MTIYLSYLKEILLKGDFLPSLSKQAVHGDKDSWLRTHFYISLMDMRSKVKMRMILLLGIQLKNVMSLPLVYRKPKNEFQQEYVLMLRRRPKCITLGSSFNFSQPHIVSSSTKRWTWAIFKAPPSWPRHFRLMGEAAQPGGKEPGRRTGPPSSTSTSPPSLSQVVPREVPWSPAPVSSPGKNTNTCRVLVSI